MLYVNSSLDQSKINKGDWNMARYKIYAHYLDGKCFYVGMGTRYEIKELNRANSRLNYAVGGV